MATGRHESAPSGSPNATNPPIRAMRNRPTFNATRSVLTAAAATAATYAAMYFYSGALSPETGPLVPGTFVLFAVPLSLTCCLVHLIVEPRTGIAGGAWAGIPAVLLIPASPALANAFISSRAEEVLNSSLPFHMIVFGGACWMIILLDRVMPRWAGIGLGCVLFLGSQVAYGYLGMKEQYGVFFDSFFADRSFLCLVLGMHTICWGVPVCLTLALMKLSGYIRHWLDRRDRTRAAPRET